MKILDAEYVDDIHETILRQSGGLFGKSVEANRFSIR